MMESNNICLSRGIKGIRLKATPSGTSKLRFHYLISFIPSLIKFHAKSVEDSSILNNEIVLPLNPSSGTRWSGEKILNSTKMISHRRILEKGGIQVKLKLKDTNMVLVT